MVDIGITDHGKTTLGQLFKQDTRYVVPFFQREYSWTKDDWSDLLEDVIATQNSERGHFFGFMAFQKHDNYVAIIEGQQRISTVTVLIALVRDILAWFNMGQNQLDKFSAPMTHKNVIICRFLALIALKGL